MFKNYLKTSFSKIRIRNDSLFINVDSPEFVIKHIDSRPSQFNFQSPKKITHSCDYFFPLVTYIYMRG